MCGIVGFLTRRSDRIPEEAVLRGMRETLAHRGPDDRGQYVRPLDDQGPFVFLGHRRLSIIDLTSGNQPLSNEDGTVWVIFNGEIYNFLELRKRLEAKGHRFRTRSDTEVIAHSYEEEGEGCFKEFNGMFAIAIWDEKKSRLILARDRLGKKPLYYSESGGRFLFGSELKALMACSQFSKKVNPLSLIKYLFYEFIPSPHTIFTDAKKLAPASTLIWENEHAVVKRYWFLFNPERDGEDCSEAEAASETLALLRQSVRRRLISDVPLGVFLSGGIDSSAVTALAQEQIPGKVKTFSIGFEDPSFDESRYALLASKHLGTEHHEQKMTPADLLDLVPSLPDILDEPMADASILPTYLLSKFTRQHVTVALGGDGGDELFAGYPTYLAHKLARPYESLLGRLNPVLSYLGSWLPVSDANISFDFKVKKFLSGIGYQEGIRNYIWLGAYSFPELTKLLSREIRSDFDPARTVEEIETCEKEYPTKDWLNRLQYLDLRLYLLEAILVKVDRASMACSLEVRAPFLDHEVVEWVMGLPSDLKLKGWRSKYILKEAMKPFLPKEVIYRKKKGFGVPIAKWAKGPLRGLFEDLLSPGRIRAEGFLNPDYVSSLLQSHLRNQKDNRKQLWTLLVWELWLDRYHPSL